MTLIMKRVFSLLLFGFLTMSVVAQQRMNFLGQPLGCSLATFKQRMVAKGYKYKGEAETNIHYFDGVFGGDDVTVGAFVTPKSNTVYEIAVVYTSFINRSKRDLDYKKIFLIKSFIKKYGDYDSEDDVYTVWSFDYGYIAIKLKYDDPAPLVIWYKDDLGQEKYNREQESDY